MPLSSATSTKIGWTSPACEAVSPEFGLFAERPTALACAPAAESANARLWLNFSALFALLPHAEKTKQLIDTPRQHAANRALPDSRAGLTGRLNRAGRKVLV